jgi:uncharacterized protein YqcC (DUF446 family)
LLVDKYQQAASYADRIEADLRKLGRWQEEPPPESAFQSRRPFYGDTMAFTQWLQFVLLARIRQVVAERGSFPAHSQVSGYAVREFDTDYEAQALIPALRDFDQFIESLAQG